MSPAETYYHEVAGNLPDGTKSKMFGAQCIKAPNGKAVAMYWKECMVFKLTGEAEQEALSLDGAAYFTPMEGRPMGSWVQVPFHYADRWPEFARQAMDYVKTIKK